MSLPLLTVLFFYQGMASIIDLNGKTMQNAYDLFEKEHQTWKNDDYLKLYSHIVGAYRDAVDGFRFQ